MLNFFGSKIKSKQVLDDIAYATQASSTLAKKIKLDERLAIILYNKAQVIPAVMIPNPDYESQQYMEMMAMEYIEKSPEQIKMLDKYKYAHVQNVEQGDLCKGILYHDDTALFPFLFKQGVNHVVATVTNSDIKCTVPCNGQDVYQLFCEHFLSEMGHAELLRNRAMDHIEVDASQYGSIYMTILFVQPFDVTLDKLTFVCPQVQLNVTTDYQKAKKITAVTTNFEKLSWKASSEICLPMNSSINATYVSFTMDSIPVQSQEQVQDVFLIDMSKWNNFLKELNITAPKYASITEFSYSYNTASGIVNFAEPLTIPIYGLPFTCTFVKPNMLNMELRYKSVLIRHGLAGGDLLHSQCGVLNEDSFLWFKHTLVLPKLFNNITFTKYEFQIASFKVENQQIVFTPRTRVVLQLPKCEIEFNDMKLTLNDSSEFIATIANRCATIVTYNFPHSSSRLESNFGTSRLIRLGNTSPTVLEATSISPKIPLSQIMAKFLHRVCYALPVRTDLIMVQTISFKLDQMRMEMQGFHAGAISILWNLITDVVMIEARKHSKEPLTTVRVLSYPNALRISQFTDMTFV